MKFHFEPNLDYQLEAIESVCDLFQGQEVNRSAFTVTSEALGGQYALGFTEHSLGYGNRLTLLDDEILENLKQVQVRNGLRPSNTLLSGDFTVEMETGTGKTYVYLRTIFELNRRYGFTKFVIVVPSVAIKEGVFKTLQMTEEHFRGLYAGVPYEYFLYDSSKLDQVRRFATSSKVQIMVVTVGAINKKDVNNLYKDSEKTGGERPIDLVKATHPVLIVDEPQSVDGGLEGKGKQALDAMDPLCTLRYSATHVDEHHMVYRLDAVDAYERKLVKQIEVASATIENAHNKPFVQLISTRSYRGRVAALVELDVKVDGGRVRRVRRWVNDGDDLEQTTGRALYEDIRIGETRAGDDSWMELRVPGAEQVLRSGEAYGNINEDAVAREMIRRTIREHLDKEKRLRPQGIKVLSLFFIPKVDLYRRYDENGWPQKGLYAEVFEEEYRRFVGYPAYQTLFEEVDVDTIAEEVHNGYFAIDRKGTPVEARYKRNGELYADSAIDADRAYELIMQDKERLLSFETPLKFIFSHSALREGWDNPNVFQICSLRDIRTERERRQTIGRGLRICVNQDGQRVRGFDINTLTVIAREGYKEFAENLQKEIEKDTGIRFGIVERHQFASVPVLREGDATTPLGVEASERLWQHFVELGYVDTEGRVQDALKLALKEGSVEIPDDHESQRPEIEALLKKLAGKLEVKDANKRETVQPRRAILESQAFRELWDRIKHKTTYRVEFNAEQLIADCAKMLRSAPPILKTRLQWRKADLAIGKAGVEATEKEGATSITLHEDDIELPDVLTELQDRTQLTRKSLAHILIDSGRLQDFKRNPQQFIDLAVDLIGRAKRAALVDGIKYRRFGNGAYYAQELFVERELKAYLEDNAVTDSSGKSVYEQIVYDSATERAFAEQLGWNTAVKVFAKLPDWFTVPTPLGSYNPDWAVVVEADGEDRVYLVIETKSSLFDEDRRDAENFKIKCGRAHFRDLRVSEPPAQYVTARDMDDVLTALD